MTAAIHSIQISIIPHRYEHRNDPNVFFITYEQLRDDTRGAVLQIADFLGPKYGDMMRQDPDVLEKVLQYSSFDFMKRDTFARWKEALQVHQGGASSLPPGLASWAESAVDSHFGQPVAPPVGIRDLMRRSSFLEWETRLKPAQEQRLRRRIREKTGGTDAMDLWKEELDDDDC